MTTASGRRVVVTGGAGYIGSVLVPELLGEGHHVTVVDRLIFGEGPLAPVRRHPNLDVIRADIRDGDALRSVLEAGADALIHLAAISNDPSSELDPEITRSINGEGTSLVMTEARRAGVRRFLYASSASVYGIKDTPDVTEDLPLEPITLYARCKADGETVLNELVDDDFVGVSIRSATVCGDSPRLRLDLTVNILTDQALRMGHIRVFGGSQMRPNVHIKDLTRFYRILLDVDGAAVNGKAFNVSRSNASVADLASLVRDAVDPTLEIHTELTDDLRSYHLSGRLATETLGFRPEHEVVSAVRDLKARYESPMHPEAGDSWYRNVLWMKDHPERWH